MDPLLNTVLSRSYQAPANPALVREVMMDIARYARALEAAVPADAFGRAVSTPASNAPSPSCTSDAAVNTSNERSQPDEPDGETPEEDSTVALSNTLKRSLVLTGSRDRFFGASSSVALVDTTALELKRISVLDRCVSQKPAALLMRQHMRPEFWTIHPWERAVPTERKPFDFPPKDLMNHLVQLYFDTTNLYVPLLHRGTFEKAFKADLHLSSPDFAQVVLGVCAAQFHTQLAVLYIQGTSTSDKCWYLVGLGVRAAQDIGLNKKGAGTKPTVEGELRKRVFWVLLFLDSLIAASVGRPAAMNISDFDVEMPIDCDDEYWDHPDAELAFKQPPGVPSKASYFCLILKLVEIHASSHRAFYSVRRPDPPPGTSAGDWDRITLANLDSALNSWADSVPYHLRWEPGRLQGIFLSQSAKLWTTYYATQILAHRAFVTCPAHKSLALTSLAICTNAARTCIRILEVQSQKGQALAPHAQTSIFTAGLMLLLNFWRARHTGVPLADEVRDMNSIFTSIKVLQTYEARWHSAGRFCDILMALVSMGMVPLEQVKRPKRRRSTEDDDESDVEDAQFCSPGPQNDVTTEAATASPTNTSASLRTNDPPASESPRSLPTTNESQENVATATSNDLPLDGFHFDTPDLAGSFSQMNGVESGQNMTWSQQLDQLQTLYGYGQPNAHPAGQLPNAGAGISAPFGTIFDGPAGAPPASTTSVYQWPNAQSPSSSTASEQGSDGLVLTTQDAMLWTGVPSGYE
ncbi:hypothetical protein H1R20_g6368, partial [Candolleomyces eurysporus]